MGSLTFKFVIEKSVVLSIVIVLPLVAALPVIAPVYPLHLYTIIFAVDSPGAAEFKFKVDVPYKYTVKLSLSILSQLIVAITVPLPHK